jgi:phage-related protein
MPVDSKKIPAVFYKTTSGSEPVRDCLRGSQPQARRILGQDIARVEYGWPIGMPTCKPLGDGLYEVRSDLPDGRIAWVLFCLVEGNLVSVHGFVKKSQKTPGADLTLGRMRQKDVQQ